MKRLSTMFALLILPAIAFAQSSNSYECTMGDLVRRVVVEREGSAPVPCEVAYYKDTEAPGERESLWNAQNDPNYCGARAAEFVERLEGWGWQCTATSAASGAARNEN